MTKKTKDKKNLLEIREGQRGTQTNIPFDYTGPDSQQASSDSAFPPYIDKKGKVTNARRSADGQGVPPFQEPMFEINMHQVKSRKGKQKKK